MARMIWPFLMSLLTLLKIVGAVLLAVLLVFTIVLLLALFVPVRYRAVVSNGQAVEQEKAGLAQNLKVRLKVTWLFSFIHISIRYGADGMESHIRAAGIDVPETLARFSGRKEAKQSRRAQKGQKTQKKKKKHKKQGQHGQHGAEEQNPPGQQGTKEQDPHGQQSTEEQNLTKEQSLHGQQSREGQGLYGQQSLQKEQDQPEPWDQPKEQNLPKQQKLLEEQDQSEQRNLPKEQDLQQEGQIGQDGNSSGGYLPGPKEGLDLAHETEYLPGAKERSATGRGGNDPGSRSTGGHPHSRQEKQNFKKQKKASRASGPASGLKAKFGNIREKLGQCRKEITEEANRNAASHIWKEFCRLLRSYKPRKLKADIAFSLADPALTGGAVGFISLMPFLYRYPCSIAPDFTSDRMYIEGEIMAEGKVRLFVFLLSFLRLIRDREFKQVVNRLMGRGR